MKDELWETASELYHICRHQQESTKGILRIREALVQAETRGRQGAVSFIRKFELPVGEASKWSKNWMEQALKTLSDEDMGDKT